jgi:hypothetical protein
MARNRPSLVLPHVAPPDRQELRLLKLQWGLGLKAVSNSRGIRDRIREKKVCYFRLVGFGSVR